MTIPPGEADYPTIECPSCGRKYDIRELDTDEEIPPTYSCPNCKIEVYQPEED